MSHRSFRNNNREKRREYKKIFIFSEGEVTEPEYFCAMSREVEDKIGRKGIKILETIGGFGNTISLVEKVVKAIEDDIPVDQNKTLSDLGYDKGSPGNDEIWVVFDKDSFSDDNFNKAIKLARQNNIKVAYSNECFEFWFLLHFNYHATQQNREWYYKKLSEGKFLGNIVNGDYKNNGKQTGMGARIYNLIKDKENDAIRNAKRLETDMKAEPTFAKRNPYTNIYELVESIRNINN